MSRRRSWWGWGYEGEGLSDREVDDLGRRLAARFATADLSRRDPPPVESLALPAPRLDPPRSLTGIADRTVAERARHAYGRSYSDVVRALRGQIDHAPDLVVRPRSEREVYDVLDWCSEAGAAVIPYGGGSSVVGGVEPEVGDLYTGAVTLDLEHLNQVTEVDEASMAARIQSGALGPALEDQLKLRGMTLRHFPQSFELSTLGGWIATRSGGHFATGPTHIDDLVESMRVVTPAGIVETRRLPGSGAGPSPDRLFIGSEGALGVITEAWVRVRPRPRWRAGGTVRFPTFSAGAVAVRDLVQAGLQPSNLRLIDPFEAMVGGAGDGSAAVLIVAFESADHPLDAWAERAVEIARDRGGEVGGSWDSVDAAAELEGAGAAPGGGGAARAWRQSFLRAPYLRDALVRLGMLTETFETAVTWDRLDELHASVTAAVKRALTGAGVQDGYVTCRFTHVYSDGPAPYFTVTGPARRGAELEQWAAVKEVASEAVLGAGGTITHHHAVGRVHRPWYDRQRPELFGASLRAAKGVFDPAGVCNPGVLVDPAIHKRRDISETGIAGG